MAVNVYDQCARYAVKLDPAGFLRWLLAGVDLAFTRWLDTQTIPFPGGPDRRCDTVAEMEPLSHPGPLWALVLELQSEPDPDILDRMMEYMGRLRQELRHGPHDHDRYLAAAAVVNLSGPPPNDTLDMRMPGAGDQGMRWRVRALSMATVDAPGLLAQVGAGAVSRCLLPWVPLMRGAKEATMIPEWRRLAETEPDVRRRATFGELALYFAEVADRRPLWAKGLEGWNVKQSQLYEERKAEGRAEGRAEGLEEGLEVGRAFVRKTLLQLLQARFGQPVPTEVAERIRLQRDQEQLSRWLELAVTAATFDEFRAATS